MEVLEKQISEEQTRIYRHNRRLIEVERDIFKI
jgi:hypothetical protein